MVQKHSVFFVGLIFHIGVAHPYQPYHQRHPELHQVHNNECHDPSQYRTYHQTQAFRGDHREWTNQQQAFFANQHYVAYYQPAAPVEPIVPLGNYDCIPAGMDPRTEQAFRAAYAARIGNAQPSQPPQQNPPAAPELPPNIQKAVSTYQQQAQQCQNAEVKKAYEKLSRYFPVITQAENAQLRAILTIDHGTGNKAQEHAAQKIAVFAAHAVDLLQNQNTMGQALDMCAVTSMANKLNKQHAPEQATYLIEQYQLSATLITNPEWTPDIDRHELNTHLVQAASAIAYSSMLEGTLPTFFSTCSTLTCNAMELTRDHSVSLLVPRNLQDLSQNLLTLGLHVGNMAYAGTKRTAWLTGHFLLDPTAVAVELFSGGILGAARAAKKFNPLTVDMASLAESTAKSVDFLCQFIAELDMQHDVWLKRYHYAEQVEQICDTIGNASNEQIGEIVGEIAIDQLACTQALKLTSKALSAMAYSARKAVQPGSKIRHLFDQAKSLTTCTQPEFELIAATEGGTEAFVFKEVVEEFPSLVQHLETQPTNFGDAAARQAAHAAKLALFEEGVADLTQKYGSKIVADAQQALKITEYKIIKQVDVGTLTKELERLCGNIKRITQNKLYRTNFIYDAAHSGRPTLSSINEGLTACAAEDQGFFKQLTRATEKGVDFVDETGRQWDIKTFASIRPNTKDRFNVQYALENIIDSFNRQENVIIDITLLEENDLQILTQSINELLTCRVDTLSILYIDREFFCKSKLLRR